MTDWRPNRLDDTTKFLVDHLGFEPNPCAFVTTVSTFLSTYCEPLTTNVTQNPSVFVAHIFLVDRKEIESFQPACKASSPPWYMTAQNYHDLSYLLKVHLNLCCIFVHHYLSIVTECLVDTYGIRTHDVLLAGQAFYQLN